jgi:hypothetical protein
LIKGGAANTPSVGIIPYAFGATSSQLGDADSLLTPPSTFMALRAGYRPILHPTLAAFAARATPS